MTERTPGTGAAGSSGAHCEMTAKRVRQLAEMPTKGLGFTKRALNASMSNNLQAQLDTEEELQREAGRTADFIEGVAAFNEKRKPVFRGE